MQQHICAVQVFLLQKIRLVNLQHQNRGTDCGLFAFSAAMSLCHGSPQEPVADEKHFVSCLENHDIVVFLTQP